MALLDWDMSMSKIFRNLVAGALIVMTPVSASYASVRPSAAVPAASAASVAQSDAPSAQAMPWLPAAVIVGTIALAIYIVSTKNGSRGNSFISRA